MLNEIFICKISFFIIKIKQWYDKSETTDKKTDTYY